ncbi:MAG: 4Fe-4S binding protein, partial [Peptococcaceae bacterium]
LELGLACPLGFLQRWLAGGVLLPQWFAAVLALAVIILLGKVFCDWACPTVLTKRVFKGKEILVSKCGTPLADRQAEAYSRYAILVGVLLSSFLFGFPVFCYICPIGLFFAFIFAVIGIFSGQVLLLQLILFPVLLLLELYILRRWCRSICPLGALLGIFGSFNRFFRPTINKDKCLTSKGVNCQVCRKNCSEGIDLVNSKSAIAERECTKCLECYEKCPASAIEIRLFSLFRRKNKK